MSSLPLTVLVDDRHAPYLPRSGKGMNVRRTVRSMGPRAPRNLVVLASADRLEDVASIVREANSRHHLRALLIRAEGGREILIPLLERAGIRALRNLLVHVGPAVPRRVLNAWKWGAQKELIAHAEVMGDRLLVVTCALDLLEVPISGLPALAAVAPKDLATFTIADDGAYLEWIDADIQLDLEAFRYVIDPAFRAKVAAARLAHDQDYGTAVAAVRIAAGLRQSDIPCLSARQVRRIEQGDHPRLATIALLAAAHGLTANEYLDRVAEAIQRHRRLGVGQKASKVRNGGIRRSAES
jgi:hypothetical protein